MAQMSTLAGSTWAAKAARAAGPVGDRRRAGHAHDRCFAFQATGS